MFKKKSILIKFAIQLVKYFVHIYSRQIGISFERKKTTAALFNYCKRSLIKFTNNVKYLTHGTLLSVIASIGVIHVVGIYPWTAAL